MTENPVTIRAEEDTVVVLGDVLAYSRAARLFFRSVLGATPVDGGYRCPRRHQSLATLILRINTFLEREGWVIEREGVVDQEVQRELERRRSFERAKETATAWRNGQAKLEPAQVWDGLEQFGWSNERTLRPHQERGVLHALAAVNAANFSVPGSGKTVISLAVAATHLAAGTISHVIVVGPLACFRPWEEEAGAALGSALRIQRIRGDASARRRIYETTRQGDLLLVSYATAASDRIRIMNLCKSTDVMLVVDESHRIKRFSGGVWAPALVDIARHARVRMLLSGTPMPQSGRDLYSQFNVLWPGGELTGPREQFAARVETNFPSVLRDAHPFVARTPKEELGLPPYEVEHVDVPLVGTQAEIYELVLSQFRRRIKDAETWSDKIDALRRGRPIRLLQAATNPALFNRDDHYYRLRRVDVASATLMERLATYPQHEEPAKSVEALRLVEQIASRGEKVVCWSNFLGNLDHFAGLVSERLGVTCFQVDGRVPTDDEPNQDRESAERRNAGDVDTRERLIARFLGTSGPAVLVTNPASCSESISLHTTCHNAIYLDRTYDCAQFLQSIDRVHRLGLPPDAQVRIHILRATLHNGPTIDHLVDDSLREKEALMRALLEGAELRPIALSDDPSDDAEGTRDDLEALLRYLLGEEVMG